MSHLLVPIDSAIAVSRLGPDETDSYIRGHGLAIHPYSFLSLSDMLVAAGTNEWVGLTFHCTEFEAMSLKERIAELAESRAILFDSESVRFRLRGGSSAKRLFYLDILWKETSAGSLNDVWAQAEMQQWLVQKSDSGNPDLRRVWGLLVLDIELFVVAVGHTGLETPF